MLNTRKILQLSLVFSLCCSVFAEDQAPVNNPEVRTAPKSMDVEIKDHCHAHLTAHGCEKRRSCYWDYYQNRCYYR